MIRITILCPEAHVGDANQLAMALGEGPADGLTFGPPGWQDRAGNRHAVASLQVSAGWLCAAGRALLRPEWDVPPYRINLTGAGRAQAAVLIWAPEPEGPPLPEPQPGRVIVIVGLAPETALLMAGMVRLPDDGALPSPDA